MGTFLNPGYTSFEESIHSEIYIDKSNLIALTNAKIKTTQKYLCISRPRRFGKSMAADMLAAYYSYNADASTLFDKLNISNDVSYTKHLNQYNVIKINVQYFLSSARSVDNMLDMLQRYLVKELLTQYKEIDYLDAQNLMQVMMDIFNASNRSFIILIDEWDCPFREYPNNTEAQRLYLDFLRLWLKDQPYVGLAYMTGILPIKKYGTHSALNMFWEYTMTEPGEFAEFFGFTDEEVRALCERFRMDYEETRAWYDGYRLVTHSMEGNRLYSMYSPKSITEAMSRHNFGPYWNQTETYEALKIYIQLDYKGLKDAIIRMMAGESVPVDISGFSNDMTSFQSVDDILSLLIHLGYLSYDSDYATVRIPNKEVGSVYVTSVNRMEDWEELSRSLNESKALLEALWNMDAEKVAKGLDRAHQEISILQYNDENSLSCAINLAFYYAREYYTIVRELPTGKGFADICLIPRTLYADKPAVVIELKYDKTAQGAIDQIKNREYVAGLEEYKDNLILAGINYDKDTKLHSCVIETYEE